MNQSTQQQQYPSTTTTTSASNTAMVQQQQQQQHDALAFNSTFADILVTMAPEQPPLFDGAPFDNTNVIQMGIPINDNMPVTTSSTNNYVPLTTTPTSDSQQPWINMANGTREDDIQSYYYFPPALGMPAFEPLAQQQQPLTIQQPHEQQQQQLPVQPIQEQPLTSHQGQVLQQQQLLVQQQLQEQQQQQQPFQPPTTELNPQLQLTAAPAMVSGFYTHHGWNHQSPSMDAWEASSAST